MSNHAAMKTLRVTVFSAKLQVSAPWLERREVEQVADDRELLRAGWKE